MLSEISQTKKREQCDITCGIGKAQSVKTVKWWLSGWGVRDRTNFKGTNLQGSPRDAKHSTVNTDDNIILYINQ